MARQRPCAIAKLVGIPAASWQVSLTGVAIRTYGSERTSSFLQKGSCCPSRQSIYPIEFSLGFIYFI